MNIRLGCIRCEVCYAIAKFFTVKYSAGEAIDFSPFRRCRVLPVHDQLDMQLKDNDLRSEACHPLN